MINFYNTRYFIAVSIVILLFLGLAFLWDSKYGIGGAGFIPPLKNYFSHKETQEDKILARLSIVFFFGVLLVIYTMYITFK